MIVTQNENTVQTGGVKLTQEFGIHKEGMGFIQNILRSQIYQNKIKSLIQETAINAVDSHVEAGKGNIPIEVTLPSKWEPVLKIKDFGVGMSEETILDLYAYFGSSSKRNSNEVSGFMGIGKVSPLSYGDSFTLTSCFDGVKNTYSIYVDSKCLTQIAKLGSEPTNESNGVEVCVAVKDYDIQNFHNEAKEVFHYFKVKPVIHGAKFEYEKEIPIISGKDWRIYGNGKCAIAIMGNTGYKLDAASCAFQNEDVASTLNCSLEIDLKIGDVDVTASREGLSYNERTKKTIKDSLTRIISEVSAELNARFQNCATLFDAHRLYGSVFDYGSNLYSLRGLVKSSLVFNGKRILSNGIHFNESIDGAYSLRVYEPAYRGSKIKGYGCGNIKCDDRTILIDNDLSITNGVNNRIYNLVVNDNKRVYLLSYRDAKGRADFITESGLEESNFIKLSSLPKIILSTVAGASPKNSKHTSKEFIFDMNFYSQNHRSDTSSNFWKTEQVDIKNDAGVYVIIDGFKHYNKHGMLEKPDELGKIITSLNVFGISLPKVYGFKVAKKDVVLANTNMVSLWTFLEKELIAYFAANKISQKLANRMAYVGHYNDRWWSDMPNLNKLMSANTVFHKNAKVVAYMSHEADKKILDEAITWKSFFTTVEKPEHDLDVVTKEVESTYPLFAYIRYWENNNQFRSAIAQYVNSIDG